MTSRIFAYENTKTVHKVPFSAYRDAGNFEFVDSHLYQELLGTIYENTTTGQVLDCRVDNHKGPVFINLKGDYDYLTRWYHNPYRKSDTRHGSYIMLYAAEEGFVWKLSDAFFTKILSIPDNITDLFDFG